jgi:hypothetical protein
LRHAVAHPWRFPLPAPTSRACATG